MQRAEAESLARDADLSPIAGIGISAKFIEKGGGDLIIIYNSGRFRMAGRGSVRALPTSGDQVKRTTANNGCCTVGWPDALRQRQRRCA